MIKLVNDPIIFPAASPLSAETLLDPSEQLPDWTFWPWLLLKQAILPASCTVTPYKQ